ncbi:MAG: bifunctional phosphatase PAP2/diacylglycerol kinase family protein [Actinomycetota bacterium]
MRSTIVGSVRNLLVVLHGVDLAVFRSVARSEQPIAQASLPRLSRAADRSVLWLGIAGGLWLTRKRFARRAALRGVTSLALTSALVNLPIKFAFRRQRPLIDVVPEVRRLRRLPTSLSFPSGHSASAFAFTTGASLELPWLGALLGPLAAGVASSRVYVGVHYPGDVLAGAVLGAAMGVLSLRLWPRARPRVPQLSPASESAVDPLPTGKGLYLAVNAAAGPGISTSPHDSLVDALPDAVIVEVDPDRPDELRKVLDSGADDAAVIGVAGGDGSVNCAAQIAIDADKPLLVVPTGTLNHLARDLGMDDLQSALDAAKDGKAAAIDVATIDGKVFVNTASFGSYVDLVDTRERLERRLGKWPALLVALASVLKRSQPLSIEVDGRETQVWMAFIGNCRYQPSGFAPSWRERLDDGELDIRMVDARKGMSRTRLVMSLLAGRLGRSRVYQQRFARQVAIRSAEPLRLARDGETFEASDREFRVEKQPRRLLVLVPPDRATA